MKTSRIIVFLSAVVFACLALSAEAADRIRTGQWAGTTTVKTRTYNTSNCITPDDAAAMNGDAKSFQAYLEKTIPPEICKFTDIKVNGSEVIYTSTCKARPPRVVTTQYYGDRFESTSSSGAKSDGKLEGPCK